MILSAHHTNGPVPIDSMPALPHRLILLRNSAAVVAIAAWALSGCGLREVQPATSSSQVAARIVDGDCGDVKQLDALVTAARLFSDEDARALYDSHAPHSEGGHRQYDFELKTQPTMVTNRHFHWISIIWSPATESPGGEGATPRMSSTGGPGGGFIDAIAQTPDKRYDLRVTSAMRDAVIEVRAGFSSVVAYPCACASSRRWPSTARTSI